MLDPTSCQSSLALHGADRCSFLKWFQYNINFWESSESSSRRVDRNFCSFGLFYKNLLPSWRNGTETSPEFVTVPLLTAGVRVGASVVNTPPQVGKAGHVRAGHVGGAGGGEGGPGVVLPPPPQPHLLRVLQPRLGRGLVAQQGEGQVPAPVPTLRPRLLPRAHNTCLEVTRVLQWN